MSAKYDRLFSVLSEEIDIVRAAPLREFTDQETAPPGVEAADPGDRRLRIVEAGESSEGPVETEDDGSSPMLMMSVRSRGYLIAAIVRQMTEVVRRHSQLMGVAQEGGPTLNIGPGAGSSIVAMTKIEAPDDPADQERAAEHLRDLSRLLGLSSA